ncbi:acyl-CoA-binding domain-containing protein 1-like [Cynara cardunculus var. scolymus]|uniref:acyl-CoA-binding domain-containing protein 1-like n=1 Tax=Cynara cardunculus var. scolymus TaxID=59895 RepID=UPI000D6290D7|nr:acyl-CoA-binding domain-containing protein 1-like [Cynara cardunculus var. scolymus]
MTVADWKQYTQSVFFGLICSFLLAKLFSAMFSFGDENLRITRDNPKEGITSESGWKSAEEVKRTDRKDIGSSSEKELLVDEEKRVAATSSDSSDDDWEGVETTELDEAFSAATAFVAATAADRSSQKVSNDLQLQLYGLYKIATEGPCGVPQPSAIKMTARAKWNAWHKLGAMSPEEAMQKYIEIITELYPTWADGSTSKRRGVNYSNDAPPMGPVFSTFMHEESGNELKLDAIHAFAREGDTENLLKCVHGGVSVDTKDSEGRTALHWAVDRGHIDVAEFLLDMNADVDLKDNEGKTALHYAAVCEREAIGELLVKRNAGRGIKDDDGNYPCDLSESNWPWIQPHLTT